MRHLRPGGRTRKGQLKKFLHESGGRFGPTREEQGRRSRPHRCEGEGPVIFAVFAGPFPAWKLRVTSLIARSKLEAVQS